MLEMSRNKLAILAVAIGALIFAAGGLPGDASAQHDGHGHTEQVQDAHGHDAHGHDAQGHDHGDAEGGHGAHGEHDAHGGDAHGDGHDDHGKASTPHAPNLLVFIGKIFPSTEHFLHEWTNPIYAFIVVIISGIFFIRLSTNLSARKPTRTQMVVELILGGLYGLFRQIIGETARKYTPYLGSLFLFIWFNNLFGLIPLGHAATSAFNTTTFALGALTFFVVQGVALKENGILGYLHHMAGSPQTALDWGFSILLFPLHVLGELIKPISLSLRLFGNIFGEETLVATMILMGAGITYGWFGSYFVPGIPLQFPFYFLGLLSGTIQATVFTLLASVYIALWLPHGHHDEEHGH